jgi:hypothetical protein
MKKILLIAAVATVLSACFPQYHENSTEIERRKQEELSLRGVESVGMPAITNFAEKRMFKDILELRDKSVATTTYLVGMNNQLTKLCDSVGYGLPYATQYTNPQRVAKVNETPDRGNIVLPQADPNGLYSPASADGTWVLCVDHKDGKAKPVYVEPRVIVSPIPLQ